MNNSTSSYTQGITDENLFILCKNYGEKARYFRQKFIGLLPEVNKRKLYEKKGFGSIFEFAAKLCGLSEEQVRRVLNLEKKLEKTPVLHSLLVNGEVSMNKLVRVQAITTSENQEFWATQVQLLPNRALETLARDERTKKIESQNDFLQPPFESKSVHVHTQMQQNISTVNVSSQQETSLQLSDEIYQKLLELQQKGININELLLAFLKNRDEEITQEKEALSKEMSEKTIEKPSRYISKKTKDMLTKEYGNKCSIPTCTKPSEQKHHTQRFSLISQFAPNLANDPKYLAPLCRNHHHIAHSIDIKYHEVRQRVIR